MPSKLPPPNWKQPSESDDRLLVWMFLLAFVFICLTEMFAGP